MLNLPEVKRRKPKPAYRKPEAVRELEQLADAEAKRLHPGMPHLTPRIFRDDKANDLTKCIVKYIILKGGFASRINNQGTYNQKLHKYIPGTSRKGLSDVMATYQGKSLHIEVKIGRDRQSAHQKKIESEVTRSGGLYYIAKDFTNFKSWLDCI
jgi:hypothetical protein